MSAEQILELVEYDVIEPRGREPAKWRFRGINIHRIRCAQRLERDLGINPAGAALALKLLEDLKQPRARLQRLEG